MSLTQLTVGDRQHKKQSNVPQGMKEDGGRKNHSTNYMLGEMVFLKVLGQTAFLRDPFLSK